MGQTNWYCLFGMLLLATALGGANSYVVKFITPVGSTERMVGLTNMINKLEPMYNYYPAHIVRVHDLGKLLSADGNISITSGDDNIYGGITKENLLLYHLSEYTYGYLVSRVWFYQLKDAVGNNHYIAAEIETPYRPNTAMQHYGLTALRPGVCPDNATEYVAGTACQEYPTAANYTFADYMLADNQGLGAQLLIGLSATRQNYVDFMSCPQLGGFNNIGHGSPDAILLTDGVLTSDDFAGMKFRNITSIIFNSCQVMNPPMSDVMNANGARFYSGGISTLTIGTSEPVTYCFWQSVLQGRNMTETLTDCANMDPNDVWGTEDPSGQETFDT